MSLFLVAGRWALVLIEEGKIEKSQFLELKRFGGDKLRGNENLLSRPNFAPPHKERRKDDISTFFDFDDDGWMDEVSVTRNVKKLPPSLK